MVSTRQMTIGHGGSSDGAEQSTSEAGPAKCTRNSTASASSSHQGKGTVSVPSKQVGFLDLPQEIIEKIFGYLTYKNICQLRFVCTRIDRICGHILNSTFQRLQHQLLDRFHEIKRKMPRRESARRNHHLACESDIIETLHMRLTLLQMSLGKHIERRHCCFFPGEILDEVLHILHYIKVTPKLARPYKVTDELFDLSTMAMEYFKEKIEPDLPEIAYFSTDFLDFSGGFPNQFAIDMEETKDNENPVHEPPSVEASSPEAVPQSNIVLRKGIRKIKQGMKRYNSQLTMLRQDVRSCRQKAAEQQKLMSEQQKQLAEQQKQIKEYATRMDENEKKNEEISRKFSTLLQELNKCKTELQYWRSKSPATPLFCTSCGNAVLPHPEELEALVNQGVNPEGLGLDILSSEFMPIPQCSNSESSKAGLEVAIIEMPEESVVTTPLTSTSTSSSVTTTATPMVTKEDVKIENLNSYVPSTSNSNNSSKSAKRKLEEKETSTRASINKKSRRLVKGRSTKRSKV